jgi:hypothetical protein
MNGTPKKVLRCAIYTRKSTEHNLDLAFTSLDAQREACEPYITSQVGEGWPRPALRTTFSNSTAASHHHCRRSARRDCADDVKQAIADKMPRCASSAEVSPQGPLATLQHITQGVTRPGTLPATKGYCTALDAWTQSHCWRLAGDFSLR